MEDRYTLTNSDENILAALESILNKTYLDINYIDKNLDKNVYPYYDDKYAADSKAVGDKFEKYFNEIAEYYFPQKQYKKGDICRCEGKLYVSLVDSPNTDLNSSDWREITLGSQLATLEKREIALLNALKTVDMPPEEIEAIVSSGRAREVFEVGDEIIVPWTYTRIIEGDTDPTSTELEAPFIIVDIKDVTDENDVVHHDALILQSRYAFPGPQYDTPENEKATESTFTEGLNYYINTGTTDNPVYELQTVTAGDPIPSGQVYYHHAYPNAQNLMLYGYSRFGASGIKQWLNSDQGIGQWWTQHHVGDKAPDDLNKIPGFMYGLDSRWKKVFKTTKIQTTVPTSVPPNSTSPETNIVKFYLPNTVNLWATTSQTYNYFQYWKDIIGTNVPISSSTPNRIFYGLIDQNKKRIFTANGLSTKATHIHEIKTMGETNEIHPNTYDQCSVCGTIY